MKKFIMIVAAVLAMGVSVHANAMPISMPYVPPMEVHVYDALFNASGVTAIDETDEQKRLAAYIDLFGKVMGAGYQSFMERMGDVVSGAKNNASIVMGADTATQLQQVIKYAMEVGYSESEEGTRTFPTYETFIRWYHQQVANLPISRTMYEQVREYWISHPSYIAVIGVMTNGIQAQISIAERRSGGADSAPTLLGGKMWQMYADGREEPWVYDSSNGAFGPYYSVNYGPYYYYGVSNFIEETGDLPKKKVVAKDTATEQAISAGKNAILTADSALTEGDVIDTTKPVIINIYRTISYPATTAEDIEEKQRELVVTNIATDEVATTEKAELEDVRAEEYGDTEAYKLDLLGFFPFCIPRDIMLLLQAFSAEAETPEFDIPFPTWENGEMTTTGYHISLAQFDNLAGALRAFQCVAFMIGLLAVTRQKYLRG